MSFPFTDSSRREKTKPKTTKLPSKNHLIRILNNSYTLNEAATNLNCSRSSLYSWMKVYNLAAKDYLKPSPSTIINHEVTETINVEEYASNTDVSISDPYFHLLLNTTKNEIKSQTDITNDKIAELFKEGIHIEAICSIVKKEEPYVRNVLRRKNIRLSNHLKYQEARVIELRHINKSYKEIADILHIAEDNVKTILKLNGITEEVT